MATTSDMQRLISEYVDTAALHASEIWKEMDPPSLEEVSSAFQICITDLAKAGSSTAAFLYLTFRPVAILLWILVQFLGKLSVILFNHLLAHGWEHIQKGAMQAKAGVIWFILFQRSLSRTEILGEMACCAVIAAIYYLRRWLRKQTFVRRASMWYKQKRKNFVNGYVTLVKRIADFSVMLAMVTPHAAFLGSIIALKLIMPSVITWIATETYASALMGVWYPLVSSIACLHLQRNPSKQNDDTGNAITMEPLNTSKKRRTERVDLQQGQPTKRSAHSFTRPAPKSKSSQQTSTAEQSISGISPSSYWLQYWMVFAGLRALSCIAYATPVLGGILTSRFSAITAQCNFFFLVWLFGMERALYQLINVSSETVLSQVLPLRLVCNCVEPLLLSIHGAMYALDEDKWEKYVIDKSASILSVFVTVRFLSEPWKEWILQLLREGRSLMIPSMTLLMPGFFTKYGVVYVQYLLPAAKSARAKGGDQGVYLQFWVINTLIDACLKYFSSLLWWVPFSTHAIYLLWCHLNLPRTVRSYYDTFEKELVTFGLVAMPGASHDISDAVTVQMFRKALASLPSASDNDNDTSKGNAVPPTKKTDPSKGSSERNSTNDENQDSAIPSGKTVKNATPRSARKPLSSN